MIARSGLETDLLNICGKFNNISSKLALSEFEKNLYYLDIRFNKYSNKTRIRFSIQVTENDEIQLQMLVDEQDERFLNKNDSEEKLFRDSKGFSIRSSFVPEIYHFESNCINLMGSHGKLISNQHTYSYYMFLQYMERVLFSFNEWAVSEHFKPKEEIECIAVEEKVVKEEVIAVIAENQADLINKKPNYINAYLNAPAWNNDKVDTVAIPIIEKCYPTSDLVMRLNLSLETLNGLKKASLDLFNTIQEQINDKIEFYKQEYQMLENIKKDIDNKKY